MLHIKYVCLTLLLLLSSMAYAGQILGSVTTSGKGLSGAGIQVTCGGSAIPGSTASDGSYRINVPQQGQCTFTLVGYAGAPSAIVFSNPNPSHYDFELVHIANGNYELRKR
jgi:hypothetical protein